MTLRALYVDFNSYFASVEQELLPELRGKPTAVLPVLADTTCCIAASYEAKKFGVKTGTPVREAKRLCPAIKFVEARPAIYIEYHHKLVQAVESCTHVETVCSIDEMACELTGSQQQRSRALALAKTIKHKIYSTVGEALRCSIGIAPNTFLAKVACDMQKPDGCVVIDDADLPDCLYRLKLRDLCGIGRNMEIRLNEHGIDSVQKLCSANKQQLRIAWGSIEGERMYSRLRGEIVPTLPSQRGSVGHSHVLPPELRSRDAAYSVLHRLTQKAAMRLRSYKRITGAMHIKVKHINGESWENQARLDPTQDTLQLLNALATMWKKYPKAKAVPLSVAITLSDLDKQTNRSWSLFDTGKSHDKLNAIIDSLNLRYGKNTVYFGGAHFALNSAPMRIAFTHIPDPVIEGDE
ncbi:MAG TPA: DNA-directed DNA polymerase [Burkholderiales bacterium]|nr:DNA-directed DNA polymerase [Burkholderiales bacterium]